MEPVVWLVVVPVVALYAAAIIYGIVKISREKTLSRLAKAIWLIAFCACMPLAAIVWGLLGPHPLRPLLSSPSV